MIELFSYEFMQRALIGGFLIALACGIMGPFIVLRRQSLVGEGLAHLTFGGIAAGILLGVAPTAAALVTVVFGALLIRWMTNRGVTGDAAVAIILSLGVGVGVILIGLAKGFTTDLFSYLIGSILSLTNTELFLIALTTVFVAIMAYVLYRPMTYLAFNERMAELRVRHLELVRFVSDVLIALVVVMSIKAAGILLVTVLLVLPALIGLRLATSLKSSIFFSIGAGVCGMLFGIVISWYANTPPSGTVAVLLLILFALASLKR